MAVMPKDIQATGPEATAARKARADELEVEIDAALTAGRLESGKIDVIVKNRDILDDPLLFREVGERYGGGWRLHITGPVTLAGVDSVLVCFFPK